MKAKKITFDLDSVIFDITPLYRRAFDICGQEYVKPTSWAVCECYDARLSDTLLELFGDDMLYTMPVLDPGIPAILNKLMARPELDILFVTERKYKQPAKTFAQLRDAGIHCYFEQVYDRPGKKSDILKELQPDIHFDDSPFVISGCLEKNVPVVMISNNSTLYNHYLRGRVEHYNSLRRALIKKGIYNPREK